MNDERGSELIFSALRIGERFMFRHDLNGGTYVKVGDREYIPAQATTKRVGTVMAPVALVVEATDVEDWLTEAQIAQEHAEAALLSLQTALLGLPRYDLVEYADYHEDDRMVLTDEGYWIKTDDLAALLPDPAGTPSPKHDDDDQARVDRDTQAATDRNYRVQQNGEK